MNVRKIFFWLHLTAGVLAGIVVLIMSLTGVLLMYEQQIIAWADREYRVTPGTDDKPLPLETFLERVQQERGGAPASVVLRSDPVLPVSLTFATNTVFADPYTGKLLGEGSQGVRKFFRFVTDWHRWLGQQGESRATGRAITGACNLAFLFIVMSGFYLWWPRQWTWRHLRPVTWFRGGLTGKARDFNWHNVIGLWCAVPLFLIVISGAVISYPWATNLIYRLTGDTPPPAATKAGPPKGGPSMGKGKGRGGSERMHGPEGQRAAGEHAAETRIATPNWSGLNLLWEKAQLQAPGWRTITLRLPPAEARSVTFAIEQGTRGQVNLRSQLELDRATASVVKLDNYDGYNLGRRIRSWLRFIHTGEAAGFLGQTIAGIASAGGVVLVWTGLMLAFRRFRGWRSRTQSPGAKQVSSATAERREEDFADVRVVSARQS